MSDRVSNALPPLYERWVTGFLGSAVPAEPEADCANCVMVPGRDGGRDPGRRYFDPTTRCCTYLPELPNFLVGAIIADPDPSMAAGRRSVEARLDRGVAVTPLGLGKPAPYTLLYDHGTDGFGTSRALRCPHHLDDGSCGIWPHRMSVCATWFCKHSRGAVGQRFWRALQALLSAVERELAIWCLLELDVGAESLAALLPPPNPAARRLEIDRFELDARPDPERYAALWGEWKGRERDLFVECGHRVARLEWPQVLSIAGAGLRARTRLVSSAFDELLSPTVPERLRAGDYRVAQAAPGWSLLTSYSGFDPLRLPSALMEALPCFDGRPVDEVLRSIERRKRLRLGRDLVQRLVDFRRLVPQPGRPPGGSRTGARSRSRDRTCEAR